MADLPISTPCGTVTVHVPDIGFSIPPFPPALPFPPFPKFKFPIPDCSLLKHIGSAEEPESDSHP